jgi:hypothetical protein
VPELERLRPGTMRGGVLAVDDAARQEAWRWIRGHPQRAAGLYFKRLWLLATNDGIVADFAILGEATVPPDFPGPVLPGPHLLKTHAELVARILRASGLLLAVAAIGGFAILLRGARDGSIQDRVLAVGFYIPLLSAAIAVNGRYRWPVEDVIAPLAGLFVSSVPRLARRA